MDMAKKVMRGEERTVFFGELLKLGMGTKEVEGFVKKQAKLRRMGGGGEGSEVSQIIENERVFVENAMNNKLIDNISVVGEN